MGLSVVCVLTDTRSPENLSLSRRRLQIAGPGKDGVRIAGAFFVSQFFVLEPGTKVEAKCHTDTGKILSKAATDQQTFATGRHARHV